MKKFNFITIIIFILFVIIISFLIKFTAECNERALNASAPVSASNSVILDAGHGGIDSGAVGIDSTLEKDINLKITYKLKALLELNGYNVIMTRSDDNSIHNKDAVTIREQKISDIKNREKIIKDNPDAIFVSIHQNKFSDPSVHGTQVFYSGNNPDSSVLAQKISESVIELLNPDKQRKIKKSGTEIYLLYNSEIPCVMVECGFMSNATDMKMLKDENYQKLLALSVLNGIQNYFKGQ